MSSIENIGNAERQSVGGGTQPGSTVSEMTRRPNKLWTVCIFILVVEMCERLCYYTLGGSMRNFLEDAGPAQDGTRGVEAGPASSISSCFNMLSYLSCIVGGYLADNRLGRYWTILYFAALYIFGVVVVAVSAYPAIMSTDVCLPLFLLGALVFVAIGTGAIKPNVMNFGAEQYDANDPAEREQMKSFFSYFYLVINIGCVGAFGYCVNLATSTATKRDPGNGYFKAFCIAAAGMFIAFLAFVSGTPRYAATGGVTHKPMMSVLRSYLVDGARKSAKGKMAVLAWCLIPTYCVIVLVGSLLNIPYACHYDSGLPVTDTFMDIGGFLVCPPSVLTWFSMGLAMFSSVVLIVIHTNNDFFVELPGREFLDRGSITLEEVKGTMACMPTILSINIGFNMLYNAMNNVYPAQACQMDTRIFGETQLNGACFTLGDAAAIIILVPIFETCLFPWITKMRSDRPMSRWAKWTVGFLLGILANGSAAVIEYIRRDMSVGENPQFVPCPPTGTNCTCGQIPSNITAGPCVLITPGSGNWYLLSKCSPSASLPMTDMSALWTLIPMFITGAGEILVNPVVYEYVFEHAPVRLRSIVQAMNFVAAGAISNALTASLSVLVPENFNTGYVVYYFYLNVAFGVSMLVAYWLVDAFGPPPEPAIPAPDVASSVARQSVASSVRASFQDQTKATSVVGVLVASMDRGASLLSANEDQAAVLLTKREGASFSPSMPAALVTPELSQSISSRPKE